jgi:iron-sulfur cluster repair protein YtfE (RIC family)
MTETTKTPIADILIRDLVELYPNTMSVLAPLGIDLCCGGGHPVGKALDLHEIDRAIVMPQIEQIVATQDSTKG